MSWPLQTTDTTGYLGVSPAGPADQLALERATQAAVRFAERNGVAPLPHVCELGVPGSCPDPDRELGAVMLAGRWYGRRTSPQGVAAFGDFGPAYVMRNDPDVAALLGLGAPGVA